MTQKPIVHRATFVRFNSGQHLTNSRQDKIPELTAEKSHFSKSCETKQKKINREDKPERNIWRIRIGALDETNTSITKKLTSEN